MRIGWTVTFSAALFLQVSCSGGKTSAIPTASGNLETASTFAEFASDAVRRAAQTYPDQALTLEPPLSLTTSDGTGLELAALRGRSVIDGPLSFTELRMQFRNPNDRVLEGRFSITLPDGAAISRLAMRIEGDWQEAEVVERQRARQAYEDFLHRRQDPALLEKEAGNQFRARIFPIPARGVKDIIVSYSHVIARADDNFRIGLRGLPEIETLDLAATLIEPTGPRTVTLAKKRFKPEADFEVETKGLRRALVGDRHAVVRVAPALENKAATIKAMTVLFDTSASRAPNFAGSIRSLGQLIAGLRATHGDSLELTVAAFDHETHLVFAGTAGNFGTEQLDRLRARRPLGASNLGDALRWAAKRQLRGRLVVVTDGIATAGDTESAAMKKTLSSIVGLDRVDVVLQGGIRDRDLAATLVRGAVKSDGLIIDGDTAPQEQARRLSLGTRSGIDVSVTGAAWTWPSQLDGLQAGDDAVVFASFPGKAPKKIDVVLSGGHSQRFTANPGAAVAPLLSRAAASAEIARLTEKRQSLEGKANVAARDTLKERIIAVSTKHRVVSDFTALLVLETEDDYKRFGIDRRALSNIMTIGAGGIELQSRSQALTIAADDSKQPARKNGKKKPKETGSTTTSNGSNDAMDADDGTVENSKPVEAVKIAESDQDGIADQEDADKTLGDEVTGGRDAPSAEPAPESRPSPRPGPAQRVAEEPEAEPNDGEFEKNLRESPPPYTGRMLTVMQLVDAGKSDEAITEALAWRNDEPGDVMAIIALGAGLEKAGNHAIAARAYGSIIDLFPSRADLRRFAGARIQRLRGGAAMAIDTFEKAVEQRPDHLTGYRLKAYALVRASRLEEAFEAAAAGFKRNFPGGRFSGGKRVLAGDLSIIGAAWARTQPAARADIAGRLAKHNLEIATEPSLRFVLNWETDANDVDFHIFDGKDGHAFYSNRELPSGGELYADITDGYGPECFAIEGPATAFPYKLQIHYYSRGPMGYGMGQVEILHHDGQGNVTFEERPFVVMSDSAYVDLGMVHN